MTRDPGVRFGAEEAGLLVEWFRSNGVLYPWTDLSDPWAIWVSEVMLQQTTVRTVTSRFSRWMDRYPTPAALAEAPEGEYLREWEGLGYYNRVRNLASAAAEVTREYEGIIPGTSTGLVRLPGVGPYIASAVASFAFGEPVAAIDANGRRIAMRLAASESWNRDLENSFRERLEAQMSRDPADPSPGVPSGELNGAVMQLGQLVCTPSSPSCGDCPLLKSCMTAAKGLQEKIPAGRKRKIILKKSRILILVNGLKVLMIRRSSGIGRGLWFFPAAADEDRLSPGVIPMDSLSAAWIPSGGLVRQVHTYTRYRETLLPELYLRQKRSGEPDPPESPAVEGDSEWVDLDGLADLPMPTAYRRIAEDLQLRLESLVRKVH